MTGKTNILFAITSLRNAGAETQALDLANGLDNAKFKKNLVIFKDLQDQVGRLDREHITYFRLFRRFKFDASIVFGFAKILRERNIEVIHCTNQFAMLIAWLARFLVPGRPRIVVALHTTINVGMKQEMLDRVLYRWILRRCEIILFVCHTQAQHWQSKYPGISERSHVVYNGVDERFYSSTEVETEANALAKELGFSPKNQRAEVLITCMARFSPEKAHHLLIEAFSSLAKNCHLLLAGDGPLRKEIAALVRRKQLEQRVHFLGNLADVRPLLSISDVTVLASTSVETFSIAMLESMSMKVPMVATDIGGLKEAIIPGVTGDLVPVGDVSALAAALAALASNKNQLAAMGQQARELVEKKFTTDHMISETEHFCLHPSRQP